MKMKNIVLSLLLISGISLQAKVYATVGDKKITDVDIDQVLRVLPNGELIKNFGGIDKLDDAKRKQIIDLAVDNYLLSKKAFQEGIDKTKEYKEELENIKNSLATQLYTKKIINSVKVSDEDAKEYYEKNKDEFKEKEDSVKARHILVKDEKEAKEIIKELEKAKDVEKKFIELAKTKSIGPSGKYGGELGWFNKKRMVPAFSKAAFALKKGEWTKKPVKTQFGYHIIYIEDRVNKGDLIPFDKIKNQVKDVLKNQKIKMKIDETIKNLRSKNKVIYKD